MLTDGAHNQPRSLTPLPTLARIQNGSSTTLHINEILSRQCSHPCSYLQKHESDEKSDSNEDDRINTPDWMDIGRDAIRVWSLDRRSCRRPGDKRCIEVGVSASGNVKMKAGRSKDCLALSRVSIHTPFRKTQTRKGVHSPSLLVRMGA